MARVTMKEIASMASVSTMTVSRAVHSPHLLQPATLQLIQRVMKRTNYVYDAIAGDLSKQKSSIIGLITPTIRVPIFAETTYAIQEIAQERGYFVIISNSNYDAAQELSLISLLQQRRVAGLILTGILNDPETLIEYFDLSEIPFMVTWETVDDNRFSYIGFDNFKAAFAMSGYLIGLKHQRIALVIGDQNIRRYHRRYKGYLAALEKYGVPYDSSLVVERNNSIIEGMEAANRLLTLERPPTAVFGATGLPVSMGVMVAIREKGLNVPRDISVAGFGDFDIPTICDPQLTTIKSPVNEMGKLAMKVLFEMIEKGDRDARQYCLETELVIRGSCTGPDNSRFYIDP